MFFRRAKKIQPHISQEAVSAPVTAAVAAGKVELQGVDAETSREEEAGDAPVALDFSTTDDLKAATGWLGQDHVVSAVKMALEIDAPGFNVCAITCTGLGARAALLDVLRTSAVSMPAPPDWVCVQSFDHPSRPIALHVPAGRGRELATGMLEVLSELSVTLPATFESEDYKTRCQLVAKAIRAASDTALDSLQQKAAAQNIALLRTPNGFGLAPMHDGKVVKPAVFAQLPHAMRSDIESRVGELQTELASVLAQSPQAIRAQHMQVLELREMQARPVVSAAFQKLEREFSDVAPLRPYFEGAKNSLIENCDLFLSGSKTSTIGVRGPLSIAHDARLQTFLVTVLAERQSNTASAPVVELSHSQVPGRATALDIGTADRQSPEAIVANMLHTANGGAVLMAANDLDHDPSTYKALKHALAANEVHHHETVHQPMLPPFKIKAVLLATEADYKRLCAADPDFTSLFKITVRCAERFESTAANDMAYAERLAGLVARDKRLPLTAAAVGAIIDDSALRSGHKGSLSLAEDVLCDILAEADYSARQEGTKIIDTDHIQRVLAQRAERPTHDGSRNAGTP